MQFKNGDRVKIIKDCSDIDVKEKDGGLEMEGVVVDCDINDWIRVESDQFINQKTWYFKEDQLELIRDKPTSNLSSGDWNTICSRCGAPAYMGLFSVTCSNCK